MQQRISADLHGSMERLEAQLHLSVNTDVKRRAFFVFGQSAVCYVLDGMVSTEFWQRYILEPCLRCGENSDNIPLADALTQLLPIGDVVRVDNIEDAAAAVMAGRAVILCSGMNCALCLDIRMFVRRSVGQPLTESVINGPHQGFNESIRDNLTLIRRILPTPDLIAEMSTVGSVIPTSLAVVYLHGITDE